MTFKINQVDYVLTLDTGQIISYALALLAKQHSIEIPELLAQAEAATHPAPYQVRALSLKRRLDRIQGES